jgi:hypothetical protein
MRTPSEFCTRELEINRLLQEYEFELRRKCALGGLVIQAVSEWFCRAGFSSRVKYGDMYWKKRIVALGHIFL